MRLLAAKSPFIEVVVLGLHYPPEFPVAGLVILLVLHLCGYYLPIRLKA